MGYTLTRRGRASFYTLGCKLNQYETRVLEEIFREEGFEIIPFGEEADVSVVNTCTVTERTDRQCRQALRRARRCSPNATVVALGCYAQVAARRLSEMPEVDLIVGTGQKSDVVGWIQERSQDTSGRAEEVPRVYVSPREKLIRFEEQDLRAFGDRTRAIVKVQEGCDHFCAYCVVPIARGPSRSRTFTSALEEVRRLAQGGYREIVLSGVRLGAYGEDLSEPLTLLDLVDAVNRIEELGRFRLSSIEPWEVPEQLIRFLASAGKFCRHLHLPLQSGDDDILRAMGRPYRASDYREQARKIVEEIPGIGLGADVIVGFPGESEDAFRRTYRLIESLPVTYLHVFPFSARPGTSAARMSGGIPPEVKRRRGQVLRDLGHRKAGAFRASLLGRRAQVVFEGRRDASTGTLIGLTDTYLRVLCDGPDRWMGHLVEVEMERMDESGRLFGKAVETRDAEVCIH